jgi:hypothetical protein
VTSARPSDDVVAPSPLGRRSLQILQKRAFSTAVFACGYSV